VHCSTAERPLVCVRRAGPADLQSLAALEAGSRAGGNWSEAQVAEELQRPASAVMVAEVSGEVVGWAVGWHVPPDELQVLELAVGPAHRRRGVATSLLHHLVTTPGPYGPVALALLEVRAGSAGAIALYEKAGFAAVGRRRRYYSDGEDAVLMNLQLPLPQGTP
jgi:ribosomal-protein-alanine acetyltransferase